MRELPTLLGGPYQFRPPPRWRVGRPLHCALRGELVAAGLTDAPVPWPYATGVGGSRILIVHADLLAALVLESNLAVREHWGVSRWMVQRWRRQLGIGRYTPGTRALLRELWPYKLPPEQLSRGGRAAQAKRRRERAQATGDGRSGRAN